MHQSELFVQWEGRIPLGSMTWTLVDDKEILLKPELEKERFQVWSETLKRYPNVYDGRLLVLNRFQVTSHAAHLTLGVISFSRVITLTKLGCAQGGHNSLGFQTIIMSPDRNYILVGVRSKHSMYCPLYLTTPGGMLEAEDAKGSVEAACARELDEEVRLEIAREKYLVALVNDVKGVSGANLIVEAMASGKVNPRELVIGNEEWMNSHLKWLSVKDLGSLDTSRALEGLVYAADQWQKHLTSRYSILWPQE